MERHLSNPYRAILIVCVVFHSIGLGAAEQEVNVKLPSVHDFSLSDLKGNIHSKTDWKDYKAVVVIFLSAECPVSNAYVPTMSRLAQDYKAKGVGVYGVYPDPEITAQEAAKHANEYELKLSHLLLDPTQVLAAQMGVTLVPESVVVSPAGEVLYRGRIDNRWSDDGRRRVNASRHDLKVAIEEVLAGRHPDPSVTKAFGCPLPEPIRKSD